VVKAGEAAVHFIESNGLSSAYTIAVGLLTSLSSGNPWGVVLSTLVTQCEQAGVQLLQGSEAVVLAQAQADLIAAGKLLPPVTAVPPSPTAA
jgi:hypothetical protein